MQERSLLLGGTLIVMLVVGALAAGSVYGVTAPATYQKSAKKKSAKKKSKRCKRSEVKRKLTYTKGRSRKRRRFTACVPRSYLKQPASLAAGLRQGRRIVVKAAPKRIARLLRKRAARRVTRGHDRNERQGLEQDDKRQVFEATTPQTLSVDIDLVLSDAFPVAPGTVHAVERYSLTIQRVRDDGSPL